MSILERMAREEKSGARVLGWEGFHTSSTEEPRHRRIAGQPQGQSTTHPIRRKMRSMMSEPVHSCVLLAKPAVADRWGFSVICTSDGYHLCRAPRGFSTTGCPDIKRSGNAQAGSTGFEFQGKKGLRKAYFCPRSGCIMYINRVIGIVPVTQSLLAVSSKATQGSRLLIGFQSGPGG